MGRQTVCGITVIRVQSAFVYVSWLFGSLKWHRHVHTN